MSLSPISATLLSAGLGGLVAACVTDVRERIIHNEIVIYVLGVGVALRLVATPELLWLSVAGAAFLLAVLAVFAAFEIIGHGDAKLISATMLLLPPQYDAQLMANIAVAGGLLSCIYLAARIVLRRRIPVPVRAGNGHQAGKPGGVFRDELAKIAAGEPMPYAVAILCGVTYSIITEAVSCIFATSCSL